MILKPLQQRGAIRRALRIPCALVRSRDLRIVGRASLDLSEAGMLVAADDELRRGDDVLVAFTFTPLAIPFRIDGKVARFLAGRRTTDRVPAAAIRFERTDAVTRLILRGQLRRIPPTLPARARRVDYAATVMSFFDAP